MGLLVSVLQLHTPEFVSKMAMAQLCKFTAAAFNADVPRLAGLNSEECLATYARFAATQAGQRLQEGREIEILEKRLYENAVEMGKQQRMWFQPHSMQEMMTVGRVLYRMLQIDFQGDAYGDVVITSCYFSRFYSCEVCRLMSSMDRGLFAGLSNGGQLTFTARITEGQTCCRGHFCWPSKGI
jgi:hypothetical protein